MAAAEGKEYEARRCCHSQRAMHFLSTRAQGWPCILCKAFRSRVYFVFESS